MPRDLTTEHLDALRSQVRAAMRVLRTTNQLLAQAAELLENPRAHSPKEAQSDEHHRHPARLG